MINQTAHEHAMIISIKSPARENHLSIDPIAPPKKYPINRSVIAQANALKIFQNKNFLISIFDNPAMNGTIARKKLMNLAKKILLFP